MNKLTRISATVASSLALVAGFSGIASAHSYSGYGGGDDWNHHHNQGNTTRVVSLNMQKTTVDNDTDINLQNNNPQVATSGDVQVTGGQGSDSDWNCWSRNNHRNNSTVGDVSSGPASNTSDVSANVSVENDTTLPEFTPVSAPTTTMSSSDSHHGGNDSSTFVGNFSDTSVSNDTDVSITNNNAQTATSGDVTVSGTRNVGDVTSGPATNTSSASFSVSVTNKTN